MKYLLLALVLAASSARAATFYLTVAGLGGEPDYEQRFASWAQEIDKILESSGADARVETLFGGNATKAKISAALADFAAKAAPQDTVVVMLIGHGSFDGLDYKFNIPGPDLSAVDLATLLDRVKAQQQLVVNMTSASGGSLAALKRENRAVIMATKSGTERNATVFARYWVEAMRDPGADTDKNEVISALEAFRYADGKTARFYETQKRLATEHAQLEDTGRGDAVRQPSPENGQGLLAGKFALLRIGAAQAAVRNPEKRKLFERKEALEQQIDRLKYQKAAMPTEEYRKQLAALLLQLAQTQAELDK